MDERFRGKGLWFGLGAVVLISLCLLLMCGAAFALLAPSRVAPVYVQPPAASEGAVQPPVTYYGLSPLGGLFEGVRMLFRLAFMGLLLLLLLGVVRRLSWGPHHWRPHYWAQGSSGPGSEGQPGGEARPRAPWDWRWHHHWGPPPWCGPAPEHAAGEGKVPGAPEAEAATGYSGPQE